MPTADNAQLRHIQCCHFPLDPQYQRRVWNSRQQLGVIDVVEPQHLNAQCISLLQELIRLGEAGALILELVYRLERIAA